MRNLLFELRVAEADFLLVAGVDRFFAAGFFATGFDFIVLVAFALVVFRVAMLPPYAPLWSIAKGSRPRAKSS
jgi:hypothetical protein